MGNEKYSWSHLEGKQDLIGRKKVDWSIFENGTHVPLDFHESFKNANGGVHLKRGEKHEIELIINDISYSAILTNVDRKGVSVDTLQIRYEANKELRSLLRHEFKSSFEYIQREREKKVLKGDRSYTVVPETEAEYIEFYKTDIPFQYAVKLVNVNNKSKNKNIWWVNQGTTIGFERKEGILWAPLKSKSGQKLYHWDTLAEVRPGDAILHYANGALRFISEVISSAIEAPKPTSLANNNWQDMGRLIRTKYYPLEPNIELNTFSKGLLDLNIQQGPIDVNGSVKQGYLFRFNSDAFNIIKQAKPEVIWPEFVLKDSFTDGEVPSVGLPNVSRDELLQAIKQFDDDLRQTSEWFDWEDKTSQKYAISYENGLYPPKQIISMATGIPVSQFSGGEQSKSYLQKRGFNIIEIHTESTPESIDHGELIDNICGYILSKGFIYDPRLIKNFFLCLKTKPFVILAGISGTGKSKLVELFADAVGATCENGQYTIIPVRPDWNDSSDLLGFKDIHGQFQPGPLTRIIEKANNNLDKPYFICLDEMNLSRVEYYFSDFLSLMETKKKPGNESYSERLFYDEFFVRQEDLDRFGQLRIPPNLYVIGTVNMDETTFPFSKKVLDRANTLEFSEVDFTLMPLKDLQPIESLNLDTRFFETEYLYLKDCLEDVEYINSINKSLNQMNKILTKANLQIGYRVRDEICFYMTYNKKFNLLDENDAFDFEIMQKILPRIQGSSNQIFTVLIDLFRIATGQNYANEDGNVADLALKYVQNNTEVKPYPRSARKIATMLGRFEDGFTSFWL